MSIEVMISSEKIDERLRELGKEITDHYGDEEVVVVTVLNGAFMFCADLIREVRSPLIVDFMRVSSYGDGPVPET